MFPQSVIQMANKLHTADFLFGKLSNYPRINEFLESSRSWSDEEALKLSWKTLFFVRVLCLILGFRFLLLLVGSICKGFILSPFTSSSNFSLDKVIGVCMFIVKSRIFPSYPSHSLFLVPYFVLKTFNRTHLFWDIFPVFRISSKNIY